MKQGDRVRMTELGRRTFHNRREPVGGVVVKVTKDLVYVHRDGRKYTGPDDGYHIKFWEVDNEADNS